MFNSNFNNLNEKNNNRKKFLKNSLGKHKKIYRF